MQSAINWFEIPTADLDRAAKFYNTIFNAEVRRDVFGNIPHGFFPYEDPGIGGALVLDPNNKPSMTGPLPYLNAGDAANLNAVMARVEGAGGSTVLPVTNIGENGWISVIRDSEGNRVGLHAPA